MKTARKLLALVLSLCVLVSLTACSSIVGAWTYHLDLAKALQSVSVEDGSEQDAMQKAFAEAVQGLHVDVILDLRSDDSYRLYVDEASARTTVDAMKAKLVEILPRIVADLYGVREDELRRLLEEEGDSLEELIAEMTQTLDSDAMVRSLSDNSKEGSYRFEDGKLYLTETGKAEDTGHFMTLELVEHELHVTDIAGSPDFERYKPLLPLVFVSKAA